MAFFSTRRTLKQKQKSTSAKRSRSCGGKGGGVGGLSSNCHKRQVAGKNEAAESMVWEFGSAEQVSEQKSALRQTFSSMRNLMHKNSSQMFLTHNQIVQKVLQKANKLQCEGYKVTAVYGSTSLPMKRKGNDTGRFDQSTNYSVVYRKYKYHEKDRAGHICKVTRTGPSVCMSKLEAQCLRITNDMERKGHEVISRVMISDMPIQEKASRKDGEYMMGRTRITIFYR